MLGTHFVEIRREGGMFSAIARTCLPAETTEVPREGDGPVASVHVVHT